MASIILSGPASNSSSIIFIQFRCWLYQSKSTMCTLRRYYRQSFIMLITFEYNRFSDRSSSSIRIGRCKLLIDTIPISQLRFSLSFYIKSWILTFAGNLSVHSGLLTSSAMSAATWDFSGGMLATLRNSKRHLQSLRSFLGTRYSAAVIHFRVIPFYHLHDCFNSLSYLDSGTRRSGCCYCCYVGASLI